MTRTFRSFKAALEYAAKRFEDRDQPFETTPPATRRPRPRIMLTVDRSEGLPEPGTLDVDPLARHGTLHVGGQRYGIPFRDRPELVEMVRQLRTLTIVGHTTAGLEARKYLNTQWRLQDAADNPDMPDEIRAGIRQLRQM